MKGSLLKIIAAASITFAAFGFAQEDDEWPQEESQEESVQSEEQDSDAEEAPATAQAEEQTSAPEDTQDNVQENSSSNYQAYAENETQAYESPARKGRDNGVGIHIAFDYGMMYGFSEEDDNIDGDPTGFGFEGGVAGRMEMVNNLYFAPELNFSYISTDHKLNGLKRTYSSMGIEIPLLIRGIVQERFYVTAGPQINLALSNDYEAETKDVELGDGITLENKFTDNVEQGTFSFGIAAGAGVRIYEGLFFDFRFYMGLSDLFPDTEFLGDFLNINEASDNWSIINMAGAKMMTLKFGLTYWFL